MYILYCVDNIYGKIIETPIGVIKMKRRLKNGLIEIK